MQSLPRHVNQQRDVFMIGMRVDSHCGPRGRHIRPDAGGSAQLVANAIFQLQRTEMRVGDIRVPASELAIDAACRIDVSAPVDGGDGSMEGLGAGGLKVGHLQENAARGARPQAGAIPQCQVA